MTLECLEDRIRADERRRGHYVPAPRKPRRHTASLISLAVALFFAAFMVMFDLNQVRLGDPRGYLAAGHLSCHYWMGTLCRAS